MDRAAILEDLKFYLRSAIDFGDTIDPEDVLDLIEELEEIYE